MFSFFFSISLWCLLNGCTLYVYSTLLNLTFSCPIHTVFATCFFFMFGRSFFSSKFNSSVRQVSHVLSIRHYCFCHRFSLFHSYTLLEIYCNIIKSLPNKGWVCVFIHSMKKKRKRKRSVHSVDRLVLCFWMVNEDQDTGTRMKSKQIYIIHVYTFWSLHLL